jgi:zona occludens toxin (predicted ATPase)
VLNLAAFPSSSPPCAGTRTQPGKIAILATFLVTLITGHAFAHEFTNVTDTTKSYTIPTQFPSINHHGTTAFEETGSVFTNTSKRNPIISAFGAVNSIEVLPWRPQATHSADLRRHQSIPVGRTSLDQRRRRSRPLHHKK